MARHAPWLRRRACLLDSQAQARGGNTTVASPTNELAAHAGRPVMLLKSQARRPSVTAPAGKQILWARATVFSSTAVRSLDIYCNVSLDIYYNVCVYEGVIQRLQGRAPPYNLFLPRGPRGWFRPQRGGSAAHPVIKAQHGPAISINLMGRLGQLRLCTLQKNLLLGLIFGLLDNDKPVACAPKAS